MDSIRIKIEEIKNEPKHRAELNKIDKNNLNELKEFIHLYPKGSKNSAAMQAREYIENIIVEEIKLKGVGTRFSIPEMVSQTCEPNFDCVGKATVISQGDMMGLELSYPGDSFPFHGFTPLPFNRWGNGSIIRFKGTHEIEGIKFTGDEIEPLSFMLLNKKGLIYLYGKGMVILKNGEQVILNDDNE